MPCCGSNAQSVLDNPFIDTFCSLKHLFHPHYPLCHSTASLAKRTKRPAAEPQEYTEPSARFSKGSASRRQTCTKKPAASTSPASAWSRRLLPHMCLCWMASMTTSLLLQLANLPSCAVRIKSAGLPSSPATMPRTPLLRARHSDPLRTRPVSPR